MRRIVLIDGENLTYGIRDLLGSAKFKADRSKLENFNYRGLVEEILADNLPKEILWFGARLQKYKQTPTLLEKTSRAIAIQSRQVNQLQKQGITFIKVGYLRARETDPCANCGASEWHLAEKGVDVGLAVRMLQEADKNTEIAIFSADTDLLPAILAAKKKGSKIMYIGYENRPITALNKAADTTRLISRPIVNKYRGR